VTMSVFVHGYAAAAAALRADSDGAHERMAQVAEGMAGSTSAQDLSSYRYMQAMVALGGGDLIECRRLARESRDAYRGSDAPVAAVIAAHADVLLGDLEGLRADTVWVEENALYGDWLERSARTTQAAILALEGRLAESLADYRRVIDEWRTADLRFDLALALLGRARLLGAVDQEAAAGRDEVTSIFSAMGADGLLDRLEAGGGPVRGAPPTGRQTSTAAERIAPARAG
jgi:hypothetical protein